MLALGLDGGPREYALIQTGPPLEDPPEGPQGIPPWILWGIPWGLPLGTPQGIPQLTARSTPIR